MADKLIRVNGLILNKRTDFKQTNWF